MANYSLSTNNTVGTGNPASDANTVHGFVNKFSTTTPTTGQVLMWNGSGWVPTTLSSAGGVTIAAPAAATAVGYTDLAFNDDFDDISTIDFAGTASAGQGKKWTNKQPFGGAATSTTSNTTVANSILTLNQNANNYNLALFTVNQSTQSNLVGPFRYGYYEAKIQFNPTQVPDPATTNGWPSWWSMGATHLLLSNDTRWPEIDFFEFAKDTTKTSGGVFAASIHDHDKRTGTEVHRWNGGNNTVDVNPTTWNAFHLYGCLWQPNSVKWYFDNTLIKTQTWTSTTQTPTSTNTQAGVYTITDDASAGPAALVLGTAVNCPMLVDWVRVWQ